MKFLLGIVFISSNLFAQTDQEISDKIVSLINDERYEEALPLAEDLLSKYPEDFAPHYNHAVICFHLKKYAEAIMIIISSQRKYLQTPNTHFK